jgi:hypothetical protein
MTDCTVSAAYRSSFSVLGEVNEKLRVELLDVVSCLNAAMDSLLQRGQILNWYRLPDGRRRLHHSQRLTIRGASISGALNNCSSRSTTEPIFETCMSAELASRVR